MCLGGGRAAVKVGELWVPAGDLGEDRPRQLLGLGSSAPVARARLVARQQRCRVDPEPHPRRLLAIPRLIRLHGVGQMLAGGAGIASRRGRDEAILVDPAEVAEQLAPVEVRQRAIAAQGLEPGERLVLESALHQHLGVQTPQRGRRVGSGGHRPGQQFGDVEPAVVGRSRADQAECGLRLHGVTKIAEPRQELTDSLPGRDLVVPLGSLGQHAGGVGEVAHVQSSFSILASWPRSSLPCRYLLMLCRHVPQLSSRTSSTTGSPLRMKSPAKRGSNPATTSSGS